MPGPSAAAARRRLRQGAARGLLTGLAVLALALIFTASRPAEASRWGEGYFPNLPVVDQDGRELKFFDDLLRDKIVVVSFIYTSCRDICPLVTGRLAQVQERLGDAAGKSIFFLSISVDPERDTPQKLKAHAEAFGVGAGWTFITGRSEDIFKIRHKLGERSKTLGDHRNEVLIGNLKTREWVRDSAFGDLNLLANTIRNMDPEYRRQAALQPRAETGHAIPQSEIAPGQILFVKACAACHTIGRGKRIGPDLEQVAERRPREWLIRYITDPKGVRASGDLTAADLQAAFPAVRMPALGMSESDASDLLAYIAITNERARTAKAGRSASGGVQPAGVVRHH